MAAMVQVTVGHLKGGGLSARDAQVVKLVGKFSQLSSTHIKAVIFRGLDSKVFERSAQRLLDAHYLIRVGRRTSVTVNGASPYVYRLGSEGRKHCGINPKQRVPTGLNNHALAVADTFLLLWQAHQEGRIRLDADKFDVEHTVGEGIRADMWVKFWVQDKQYALAYYIEVDLGSEPISRQQVHGDQQSIEEKCQAYWYEYERSAKKYWPTVCFVVPDERRQLAVSRFISTLEPEQQGLFMVLRFDELVDGLTSVSFPQEL